MFWHFVVGWNWFTFAKSAIMEGVLEYRKSFLEYLEQRPVPKNPIGLYEPVDYILNLGGKRLRPLLTLMAADAFGTFPLEAMPAALAVEMFHNFSLVHDDIMDEAPLRRGKPTVHEKWDLNTGILSGDAMIILAYRYFEEYPSETFKALAQLFSKTALEVCEGQQYDIDFETTKEVALDDYIHMIRNKTAVLVGAALKMGAIVAHAKSEDAEAIYDYGVNLGLAFQIQDDYLDAFGDQETFGKQVGGDIIENKKTYLYIKALELSDTNTQQKLRDWFATPTTDAPKKIAAVKQIFEDCGVKSAAQQTMRSYTASAFRALDKLSISEDFLEKFKVFGNSLMQREV